MADQENQQAEETFLLCVAAPEHGTPEEIREWLGRVASDLANAERLELVPVAEDGPLPREQHLRKDRFGTAWDDGRASIRFLIRCPGKVITPYKHPLPKLPDPGPLKKGERIVEFVQETE